MRSYIEVRYAPHLDTGPEVCQLNVARGMDKKIVRLHIAVYVSEGVDVL